MITEPLLITQERTFRDSRGVFFESYKKSHFADKYKFEELFVQENHSISYKNVIRGLHYQWDPPMGKLVRVVKGEILDVIVDIRKSSSDFGKVYSFKLSESNKSQLYVPPGFAHGFAAYGEENIVLYKCTAEYSSSGESGINPMDKTLNIGWGILNEEVIISDKDSSAKTLEEYKNEGYKFN